MLCFVDIDGVLTDFPRAFNEFHNLRIPYNKFGRHLTAEMNMSITKIDSHLGKDFWANLPWLPTGKQLLKLVEKYFCPDAVCLFSFPSFNVEAPSGKVIWIKNNLPNYMDRFLLGTVKHFCACSNTVLLDDKEENITAFEQAGGKAILVPAPWNSFADKNVIKYIDKQLQFLLHELRTNIG